MLDGHTLGAVQVVITDAAWAKLSEEQQGWIMEAAKYASEQNAASAQAAEDAVLAQLIADGITVIEVEDKAAWQAAVADVEAINNAKAAYADLYNAIVAMQ